MQNELLGNILNNIVMEKVVRDKIITQQKEQREEEARQKKEDERDELDDFDDPQTRKIMQKMREERMQKTADQPIHHQKRTIGEYREIVESEFLNYVTKIKNTVVHFFHKDFARCKIMDKHLQLISQQYPNTQFLSIDAEKSPFFVERLAVRVLPTLCIFIDGIMKDKIVGFEGLSGDQFNTHELVYRMSQCGIIDRPTPKDKTLLKSKRITQSDSGDD